MKLCLCGCDQEVIQKSKYHVSLFIKGHSSRGKFNPIYKPENHIIETRTCICGCNQTFECPIKSKKRFINGHNFRGITLTELQKEKIKIKAIERYKIPENRKKTGLSKLGHIVSDETRKKTSISVSKGWQDTINREKWLNAIIESTLFKQNNSEKFLEYILNYNFPNEWKYCGFGRGKIFTIHGKRPDFININGKRLIIELYGDYWHGKEVDSGRARIAHFKKHGYSTLIIWEHELFNNYTSLVERITDFISSESN